jgi:hypothetical protein
VFRVPVTRGRRFTEAEADAEAAVAIVSESTARRFWPGREAVGETIAIPPSRRSASAFHRWPGYASARVIGVAKDISTGGGDDTCIYFPTGFRSKWNDSLVARVTGGSAEGRRTIEQALERVAPSIADFINPMEDAHALMVYPFRVTFWIAAFLAGVALLLTVTGIYGVMSYLVSQRTKEIGIRVALGAGSPTILWMVMRQSGRLAAIGAAIGAGLALAVAPVFANAIGNAVRPYEAMPYVVTVAVVFGAAVAASYAPSRRAVRIDPVVTLRAD